MQRTGTSFIRIWSVLGEIKKGRARDPPHPEEEHHHEALKMMSSILEL
jgi:hypothetical protein